MGVASLTNLRGPPVVLALLRACFLNSIWFSTFDSVTLWKIANSKSTGKRGIT